ncbi:hypothetical protein L596_015472 [Steinernema carpocapsae]|uniref:Uncharacterized protein n=1 Tax=Steinernema carpocapsae TaxID=34508 RepID=A0A4U5NGC8_STECR|nr:hypothetical protein L596_015472 [Steinernema carpocapsae]
MSARPSKSVLTALAATDSDSDSTTVPSQMSSYSNTNALLDDVSSMESIASDVTERCNREALAEILDEIESEASEYSSSSPSDIAELQSEYCLSELNDEQIATNGGVRVEKPVPPRVPSVYAMDFVKSQ